MSEDRQPLSAASSEKKGRPPPPIQVLIAESDSALGDLYREALDGNGWEVMVVAEARLVLERFQQAPPTVLLLNTLPDADAVTVVEQVRSMTGTQDVVIVVLYDSMDRVDVQRLAGLDVQAWLSKTRATREQLSDTIRGLVASGTRAGGRDQR